MEVPQRVNMNIWLYVYWPFIYRYLLHYANFRNNNIMINKRQCICVSVCGCDRAEVDMLTSKCLLQTCSSPYQCVGWMHSIRLLLQCAAEARVHVLARIPPILSNIKLLRFNCGQKKKYVSNENICDFISSECLIKKWKKAIGTLRW